MVLEEEMRNLKEFGEYLKKRELVCDSKVPFFILWVKKYLQLGSGVGEHEFSILLETERKEDWKIRQALDAVKLYMRWCGSEVEECVSSRDSIDTMQRALRVRHYSLRTEKSYLYWSRKYLLYCDEKNLDEKSSNSFTDYLTHLDLVRHVAASTQNQAFNSLLFLFRNTWSIAPEGIDAVRARKAVKLPEVLSPNEVRAVLAKTYGVPGLIIRLIYSSGMRLCEALSLRVKDVKLSELSILIRGGKGYKDRVGIIGRKIVPALSLQIELARSLGVLSEFPVSLPGALARKYPAAGFELEWRYVFPAKCPSVSPRTGKPMIHHMHPSTVQREMRRAVGKSGIRKRASVHTLRHCFATHLLMSGVELCEIQELLGHKNLETTRIYIHIAKSLKNSVLNPLDMLSSEA